MTVTLTADDRRLRSALAGAIVLPGGPYSAAEVTALKNRLAEFLRQSPAPLLVLADAGLLRQCTAMRVAAERAAEAALRDQAGA